MYKKDTLKLIGLDGGILNINKWRLKKC
jgi:hypothetical protein